MLKAKEIKRIDISNYFRKNINNFFISDILLFLQKIRNNMTNDVLTIPEQIKIALDGRTQRWLSFEVRIPEPDLSKKMNGEIDFKETELAAIETRLNFKLTKEKV